MRVAFVIRSLGVGGAERQVTNLARGLARGGHEVALVTFYPGGSLEEELQQEGVRLVSLGKKGRWDLLGFVGRLRAFLRSYEPDIVHSYLEVSNLLVAALRHSVPHASVIWGIRSSFVEFRDYDLLARTVYRAQRYASRFVDRIIVNSFAGRRELLARGIADEKIVVIQNGIDLDAFAPDSAARQRTRRDWRLLDRDLAVGIVGRIDPMKDHDTFLRAAAMVTEPPIRFVVIGEGSDAAVERLKVLSQQLGVSAQMIWLGRQTDMRGAFNALDLLVSSSAYGEGFPNVVAEAMACGVPVVATDVGDSAVIIGDAGLVVPRRDPAALSEAIKKAISVSIELSAKARERIVSRYSVERLIDETERVMKECRA